MKKTQEKTNCYISNSIELDGNLKVDGNVQFDGTLVGYFECDGVVYAGKNSYIKANLMTQSLNSNGIIDGNIVVADSTIVHKNSKLSGHLKTCHLIIEEGSNFDSQCEILSPIKNKKPKNIELRKAQKAIQHRD